MGSNFGLGYGAGIAVLLDELSQDQLTLDALSQLGISQTTFGQALAQQQQGAFNPNLFFPFDPQYFVKPLKSSWDDFANDFPMPEGTAIYAPEGGIVEVKPNAGGWGKQVRLRTAGGQIIQFSHLSGFSVKDGETVKPGQQIARSGNTGNSTGPHLEIMVYQRQQRKGPGREQFQWVSVDPIPFLTALKTGNVADPQTAGYPFAGKQPIITPDGHQIAPGSADERYYIMADSIWTKIYGQHPPWAAVQAMRAAGVNTLEEARNVLNAMPSGIPGVTIGAYETVGSAADKLSNKFWGRPASGALIRQFFKQGITTPGEVQQWFLGHPAKDMPVDLYQQIYDLALPYATGLYNDSGITPDQVYALAQAAGYTGDQGTGPPPVTTPAKKPDPAVTGARGGKGVTGSGAVTPAPASGEPPEDSPLHLPGFGAPAPALHGGHAGAGGPR
jgi:hypothetical protein